MALLSRPPLRSVRRPDSPKSLRDRRKSSPDCLDTTAEPRVSPLKSRRARGASASSINTIVSGPLATTQNGGSRARQTATPSADLLRGVRESPDPLDTISPAPKQRILTPAIAHDVEPGSPVPRPRRNDRLRGDGASATVDRQDEQTEKSTGRRSLRSTDTGSRCKSELAQYFHNYEQIISLEDPEPGECFSPCATQQLARLTRHRISRCENHTHTRPRPGSTAPYSPAESNTLRKSPSQSLRL